MSTAMDQRARAKEKVIKADVKKTLDHALNAEQKNCLTCGHFTVCSPIRAIGPLMQKWTDATRPFDPNDIGKICGEWFPASLLKNYRNGSQ